MHSIIAFLAILELACPVSYLYSCTSFAFLRTSKPYVAHNFDFDLAHGLVVINPRELRKCAAREDLKAPTLLWKAKYGSVTFNQLSLDHPVTGMNEEGLIVNVLINSDGEGTFVVNGGLNEVQFAQYLLDNFKDLAELREALKSIPYANVAMEHHYFICDQTATCVVLEADVEAKQFKIVHEGTLPQAMALANSPYIKDSANTSEAFMKLDRFPLAHRFSKDLTTNLQTASEQETVAAANKHLFSLSQGDYSKWRFVYNIAEKKVHYRHHSKESDGNTFRTIDLTKIEFAKNKGIRVRDFLVDSSFQPFSANDQMAMVLNSKPLLRYVASKSVVVMLKEYLNRLRDLEPRSPL